MKNVVAKIMLFGVFSVLTWAVIWLSTLNSVIGILVGAVLLYAVLGIGLMTGVFVEDVISQKWEK